MSKALISVTNATNKCVDRLWKTNIGIVEYSIATTFRSTCTDTILYWKYGTLPYIFLVHLNPHVSKNYGDWMNYDQFMTVRPCTAFVRNRTTVQYVTVRYRVLSSNSQHYFCEFEIRPLWLYLPFEIKNTWYWCALCYWKTRITCVVA
jgi:hypothetical protein